MLHGEEHNGELVEHDKYNGANTTSTTNTMNYYGSLLYAKAMIFYMDRISVYNGSNY